MGLGVMGLGFGFRVSGWGFGVWVSGWGFRDIPVPFFFLPIHVEISSTWWQIITCLPNFMGEQSSCF
jgi:hypothetical protein